jgi:hypothetical protein
MAILCNPATDNYDITSQKWSLESELWVQSINNEYQGVKQFFPLRRVLDQEGWDGPICHGIMKTISFSLGFGGRDVEESARCWRSLLSSCSVRKPG